MAVDTLILSELQNINRLLIVQQYQTNNRFDEIDRELKLIYRDDHYITPELERAVKKVALRTRYIDRKVGN